MAESCQNPLLADWLKERWDVAEERRSKGATVYKKAYQSMLKCPLKLKHPSEAQTLQGIGPKLADWLTDKLKAHCEANGLPMPTKGRQNAKRNSEQAELSDRMPDDSPERPAKKQRQPKEYVPALRSGAYGIIMALSELPEEGSNRGMSKTDLIREAQPFCDSSYTEASHTNKFYTAWKSMDTLEKKELVCNFGKPVRRYQLTDEGWEVARKMRAVENRSVPQSSQARNKTSTSKDARSSSSGDSSLTGINQGSSLRSRGPSAADATEIDVATVIPARSGRFTAIAMSIVQNAVAPTRGKKASAPAERPGQTLNSTRTSNILQESTIAVGPEVPSARRNYELSTHDIVDLTSSPQSSTGRTKPARTPINAVLVSRSNGTIQQPSIIGSLKPSSDTTSLTLRKGSVSENVNPVVLPAGSFEVKLVLDNREVRSQNDRDYISLELQKHGVNPIVRPLELGDALWVAEIRSPYDETFLMANPDDEGEGRNEIVLDHIMERKRLDDLLSSIKDGRLHEQKFRLRKSGIKNIIYLIEEFSISAEREERYGEALESAIAGMQIVNGFFVKQTTQLAETVSYLANMTKALKDIYERRDLRIIPSKHLDIQEHSSMMTELHERDPETSHYITFAAFSLMCTKSDSLTLRDVYLRMLMCAKGLTGEKAMEIQKRWPTPRALIEAYESAHGAKAKESLISDQLGGLISRKKIAKGLSAKIAEIWA